MRNMVVVAYRPKPGCEAALTELVKEHVPRLRRLGLATERPALAGIGESGTIVEIFEWREGAIAAAHDDPAVRAMWDNSPPSATTRHCKHCRRPASCSRPSPRST